MNEHRIYVIVPKTVQSPLEDKVRRKRIIQVATKQTKTTVQPVGRIGAQIGHVTSKMRMYRLVEAAIAKSEAFEKVGNATGLQYWLKDQIILGGESEGFVNEGITTIVLSVPDSFWLEHIHSLMRAKKIKTFGFIDTNEEYGGGLAKTAICTLPIDPAKLDGIIDYLPLWVHP
jgi:hypothetical protein